MLLQSGQPTRVQFPVGDHVTAHAATHGRIRVGARHMGDVAPMAPHDRLSHHAHHALHLRIGELAGAHVHGGRLRCVGQWGDGWQLLFGDHLPVGAGAAQGVESGVQFVGCVAVVVGQMAGEVMALPIGQHGGDTAPRVMRSCHARPRVRLSGWCRAVRSNARSSTWGPLPVCWSRWGRPVGVVGCVVYWPPVPLGAPLGLRGCIIAALLAMPGWCRLLCPCGDGLSHSGDGKQEFRSCEGRV